MEAREIVSWWGWMILIPILIASTSFALILFMDLLCSILERKDNNDE